MYRHFWGNWKEGKPFVKYNTRLKNVIIFYNTNVLLLLSNIERREKPPKFIWKTRKCYWKPSRYIIYPKCVAIFSIRPVQKI